MKWEVLSKKSSPDITNLLLANRGVKTAKGRKEFLDPRLPEKWSLAQLGISQIEIKKAKERIKKALRTKERVVIYGDYDADGICGTAILWETLHNLGLNVWPYIPERFSEGYGLNPDSLRKLKEDHPDLGLVITVDHGVVANQKVDLAKDLGIDVIITDHHEPGKTRPKALAVIHTVKIGGAAVAWNLAREVSGEVRGLDLVAIGTISDQLPLIGPNRSFTKYGLEVLNQTDRVGLLALFGEASLEAGKIGPYEVGFIIAPRLNAMGRLTHGLDSLRLLCLKGKAKARELAALVGRTNAQRQKIVEEVVTKAREKLGKSVNESVIVLAHEDYHEGVIGLAAAKIVEEFYRPAIVLSKKGEISKASARSISGFNIIESIRKLSSLYLEGGGHPMAAGFSIQTTKIKLFARKINELAKPLLTEEILARKLRVDLEIDFDRINYDLWAKLREFEPTGLGNPTPSFVTRKVAVVESRLVGREGKHLRLKLRQKGVVFEAIAFGLGTRLTRLPSGKLIDVVYVIEENVWNGKRQLQLKIRDLSIH